MKKISILFLIAIIIGSCTSRTIYKKPKNLIDKEKMINIWTDLYIARGARSVKTISLKKNINYVPMVLEKYQIDSTQFSKSNIYYTSRIEEYEKMFTEVQNRLEILKKEYTLAVNIDSLRAIKRDSLGIIEPIPLEPLDTLEKIKENKKQKLLENIMK